MLNRKMLRELRRNVGQFLSVFLLAALAMFMYVTMQGHVIIENDAREVFHEKCELSDLWVYSEEFSEEQLRNVRGLDFVDKAQLRTLITGSSPEYKGAQVDIILEDEDIINHPVLMEGQAFDPSDAEGVWLTETFAKLWNIQVGDDFSIDCKGMTFNRKVKGLVEAAEYEFRQADGDADQFLDHIAFVYMSYEAFPAEEYMQHLIRNGKVSFDSMLEDLAKKKEKKSDTDALPGNEAKDDAADDFFGLGELLYSAGAGLPEDVQKDLLLSMMQGLSKKDRNELIPYTTMIVKTKDAGALAHEDDIAEALKHDYSAIVDRKSVSGLYRFDAELSQHKAFSWCFMVIFLGIAVLVIGTSMKRIVEKQRVQIGTMNALGLKKSRIMLHYLSFSFLLSSLGSIAGLAAGYYAGAPFMVEIFSQYYILPERRNRFSMIYVLLAVLITGVCVFADWFSCRSLLKIHPAEALRPAAPAKAKRCLWEKLPFWNRLSFSAQYNLRDISRGKLRALMGMAGTAVGMVLIIYGIGCNGLVDDMIELAYGKLEPAAYQVKLSEDIDLEKADEMAKEADAEIIMTDALEVALTPEASSENKLKGVITVTEGKGYSNIVDADNHLIPVPDDGVALSRRFAESLGVSTGDMIYWHLYSKNQWYSSRVKAIYRGMSAQGMYMQRREFEKYDAELTPALLMTDHDVRSWKDNENVISVNAKTDMIAALEKSYEIINILVWFMSVMSALMIIVVLYNSGSISFNERVKEFATLKVIGLQSSKIRKMLSQQNLWLSLIGIIAGAPFGKLTLNAMMNSNGDNFDYNLQIRPYVYVISGIFVMIVSVMVSYMFSSRIRKLDMAEVLKGVE